MIRRKLLVYFQNVCHNLRVEYWLQTLPRIENSKNKNNTMLFNETFSCMTMLNLLPKPIHIEAQSKPKKNVAHLTNPQKQTLLCGRWCILLITFRCFRFRICHRSECARKKLWFGPKQNQKFDVSTVMNLLQCRLLCAWSFLVQGDMMLSVGEAQFPLREVNLCDFYRGLLLKDLFCPWFWNISLMQRLNGNNLLEGRIS